MKKNYIYYGILLVLAFAILVRCDVKEENKLQENQVTNLDEQEYNFIRNVLVVQNKPHLVYEKINKIIKEIENML
jgi:hypothetical protein